MIFDNVKDAVIPNGNVKQIACGGTILWSGEESVVLPDAYQQVRYIRTDDNGGQLIDTGVAGANNDLKIEISYMWDILPAAGTYHNIIAAYVGEAYNTTRIIQFNNSGTYVNVNLKASGGTTVISKTRYTGTLYKDVLTKDAYITNGAEQRITATTTGSANNHNLYLFSNSNGGGFAKSIRLYACKLYNGTLLLRDFIPCYRKADDVIGLYDIVNDTFYTNGGTGAFIKGADV